MSNERCFVFRVNYSDSFGLIRNELTKDILRQGWGAKGMRIDAPVEQFIAAWKEQWPNSGDSTEVRSMKRKYNNLRIMTEIQVGDLIVIPKLSMQHDYVGRFFTIARCDKTYDFYLPEGCNDFGHYLKVKPLISCPYDYDGSSQTICAKFNAYRSAVNHVYNADFVNAVNKLLENDDNVKTYFEAGSGDYLKMISDSTKDDRNSYLNKILGVIRTWPPKTFEYIIQKLFESNGYIRTDNNTYDGEGGDIDITFSLCNDKSLLGDIYEMTDKTVAPDIHVQAKKKTGPDPDDITGVQQLLDMEKNEDNNNIKIVINLTDDFTPEAKRLAEDHNVLLLNGSQFTSLLVRYGLDVQL
jgi:hypothetical protein